MKFKKRDQRRLISLLISYVVGLVVLFTIYMFHGILTYFFSIDPRTGVLVAILFIVPMIVSFFMLEGPYK